MARKHYWNWLPPRFPTHPTARHERSNRPPLPQLENLEDRVLLSTDVIGDGGTQGILIGLLKNQISLRASELDFFKVAGKFLDAGDIKGEIYQLFEDNLLKVETAFSKITQASFFGNKANIDIDVVKINDAFLDLEDIISGKFGDLDEKVKIALLPAVQKMHADVDLFTEVAEKFSPTDSNKFEAGFMKFQNDFLKIYDITDKLTTDLVNLDGVKLETEWKFDSKIFSLEESFLKAIADLKFIGDGSVYDALSADLDLLKFQTTDFLGSFLNNDDDNGDIDIIL